jgi:hypothetical protein
MKECKWMGQSFSAFKNHFSFCHHFKATIFVNDKPDFVSVCLISNCGALFLSRERCLQHSRNHFTTKSFEESIPCPFLRCEYTFFSKGAFKTHVWRMHKEPKVHNYTQLNDMSTEVQETQKIAHVIDKEDVSSMDIVSQAHCVKPLDECLVSDIGNFYLALQAKYFIPASTIQIIVQTCASLHHQNNELLRMAFLQSLTASSAAPQNIEDIVNDIFKQDIFTSLHDLSDGVLRSTKTRLSFFRAENHFVAPTVHILGHNSLGKLSVFHYVSISRSLEQLLLDKNISYALGSSLLITSDILSDYTNGCFYTKAEIIHRVLDLFNIVKRKMWTH